MTKSYKKQVDKSHYRFDKYVQKKRWISIWHQLDDVLALNHHFVLELGVGSGLFKALAGHFGVAVTTVDIDTELKPDYMASATDLPFDDNSYDCVCAFQMLEHLPYEQSLKAFGEMARVARHHIVISLPDAKRLWAYTFHIPKIGDKTLLIPRPCLSLSVHKFDGEHYWEINKLGYHLQKIIDDFNQFQVQIIKTYRVAENPYHRFFVFKKISR